MAVQQYGVLKGIVLDMKRETDDDSPHFQVKVLGEENTYYRCAINVMSSSEESEVLYVADDQFDSSTITTLPNMPYGYARITEANREIALDYVRGHLFDSREMKPLRHEITGPDNDLNDFIETYMKKALVEKAPVYLFGSKFGPEQAADKIFGFTPTNGMHNIHMNQGNAMDSRWKKDNGSWHDGGILIQFADQWAAVFLAFLSQSWCTDENGNPVRDCDHTQTPA
ncbi:YukJ family protein [Bacillus vallismortis]|uniref:YukJ family protein n=1 Tax=Bacillus vallismortis TaxID=72361 RepID=UPI00227FDB1B|nr:YukJ family protein [Bacillus vallismortis]MCY7894551.1 YukJ family protein [Bacillus vallismortis]MCY8532789.1 YukJ family protein [Bacillus vallismortis]MEC1268557.1 YukJ family protein [Bacillus vallismortis]MEC1649795.1 YukJ family protein [Bacillus vallismortis]